MKYRRQKLKEARAISQKIARIRSHLDALKLNSVDRAIIYPHVDKLELVFTELDSKLNLLIESIKESKS